MATITSETKKLSIFIDRFIPSFWSREYPNFKLFFKYFLEYLEQNNNVYEQITNIVKFVDIDKINELINSSDPEEVELGNKLLNQVYEQFLGSVEARYLSTLMDSILYIKKQKGVLRYKGTKYSFLFFFLLMLGGYFKIYNATYENVLHNGVFKYNGLIYYASKVFRTIQSFIYIIESEFEYSQYAQVLNTLNPAGMYPIVNLAYHDHKIVTSYNDILDNYESDDLYIAYYYNSTPVLMMKPFTKFLTAKTTSSDYDELLIDGSKWSIIDGIETGESGPYGIFFKTGFNTAFQTGMINEIKMFLNPTPNGEYYYNSFETGEPTGTLLYENTMDKTINISDNTLINIVIEFEV